LTLLLNGLFSLAGMKIALITSLICMMLGLAVIIGGAIALPLINSAIDGLQNTASNYLIKAENVLSSAQNAINSTQVTLIYLNSGANVTSPSLADSGQLTSNAVDSLNSLSQNMSGAGENLSNSTILGATSLASVGSTLSSLGQRIHSGANSLKGISSEVNSLQTQTSDLTNRINTITIELGNLNNSLTDMQYSVAQTQSSLSSYFNPVRLVSILGIAGLMGLGGVFLLIGISIFTLRRKTIRLETIR
jgi:hypothetical protein